MLGGLLYVLLVGHWPEYPQGSVLGGLLYVHLVGNMPEVVHDHAADDKGEQEAHCDFNITCHECGGLSAFVDDSTYQVSSSSVEELSQKLSTQHRKLADYMGDTGLVINDDKTHLIVIAQGRMKTRERKSK